MTYEIFSETKTETLDQLFIVATATAVTLSYVSIATVEYSTLIIHRSHVDVLYTEFDVDEFKLGLQERYSTEKDMTRDAKDVAFTITSAWWQDLTGTTDQDDISGRAALASEVWHDGNIWPGWDNNALKGKTDEVNYKFTKISSPGEIVVYQTAHNGPTDYAPKYSTGKMAATAVLADGSSTLKSGDVMKTGAHHLRMNWASTFACYVYGHRSCRSGGQCEPTTQPTSLRLRRLTAVTQRPQTMQTRLSLTVGIVLAVLGVLGAIIAAFANPMIPFSRM